MKNLLVNHDLHNKEKTYDRILKYDVLGIAAAGERFMLDNGYYVNETDTIIIRSTNETGKYFKKI